MSDLSIKQEYQKKNHFKFQMLLIGVVAVMISGMWFVTIGITDTSIGQVWRAILAWLSGTLEGHPDAVAYKVILLMRLPRVALALLAGVGLAVSGVAMQGITRNPLVSPFTVGISSAAAFGASLAIVFGFCLFPGSDLGTVLNAFICSLLCVAIVYLVSKRVKSGEQSIVLTGIALNYLFSAMSSTIEFFAEEHDLADVVQWSFGTFNGSAWNEVIVVGAFVTVCTVIIARVSLKLNVISLGDDELVKSVGVNPEALRNIVGLLSVLMTAAIISFTGVIGFVGLVAPHVARMLIGNDHRFLIPFSALFGAFLLMASDVVGRVILAPVSIPVGIVVSFLGVPLFVHLILKKRREYF